MSLSCLIVDDSEDFLASAAQLFSVEPGVRVAGLASSGDEAMKLADELRPDVVLVDVELGEEDGIELARRLTSGGASAQVILISLRDHEQLIELIAGSGAAGFLRKDTLDAQAVTDLIARRSQREAGPQPQPSAGTAEGGSELAREDLRALAEQQGALRRVATLAAQGAEPEQLFDAIAAEASRILGVDAVSLIQYDADTEMLTQIAVTHGRRAAMPPGSQWPVDTSPLGALIIRAGQPARLDDWTRLPGLIAARHVAEGFGQGVGAPIVVDGAVWGYIAAYGDAGESLPPGCETRLADLTHLMGMAISNAQAHEELRGLAESQGALRRVATLVAQGAEPRTVFSAVAVEAARLLGVGAVSLISYDAQIGMFTKIFGTHGDRSPVPDGTTWPAEDCPEGVLVLKTGQPARVDDWTDLPGPTAARHRELGFGQAVAAPIIIDGTIWGHIAAYGEADEIIPAGCESRLADYTHLMASAIANAQARDELRGLAEQQGAALRRVATLVARQASSSTIFAAVAGEASRALRVPRVDVGRCPKTVP